MFNPYPDLPHRVNNYVLNSVIGQGGFAIVYKATSILYNMDFALKVVCKSKITDKNYVMTYEAEINSLTMLDHPNVIKLYDFFVEDDNMFLVLEYCSGGTLEDRISKKEIIPNEVKISICTQIISALKYCYDMSIAHQDIKAANILFDSKGRVKISDFGLSGFINHDNFINQHKGTVWYLAPEVCQKGSFNPFKSDIWSLGVLFYRLFSYTYPFEGNTKDEIKEAIINGFFPERLTGRILKPVRRMLIVNPEERISIHKLSQMKIFAIPLNSPTCPLVPKLKTQTVDSLNIKLSRRRSSLVYNQKLLDRSKVRHHSFNQYITNPLTFT